MRSWKRAILTAIAFVLLAAAVSLLGLRVYFGREAENRLAADEVIDFSARASAARSNVFAMCPSGYCTPQGDMVSPVFAMGWKRLRDYWAELIAVQPGIEPVAWDGERRRLTYVQRSEIFRFPDIVTVEFVKLGESRSTLAIDSRSRYGTMDLGANRRRVTSWMAILQNMTQGDRLPGG